MLMKEPGTMPIPPVFDAHSPAVFLACDGRFLPHTLVAVASIMENGGAGGQYDIVVLTDGVPQERIEQARLWFADRYDCNVGNGGQRDVQGSLRFFDVGSELEKFGRDAFHVTKRYPLPIYFRFFAPSLFAEYDRIIYLDSDMIVLADIAELFREDLAGNIVGACHDAVFEEEFRRAEGTPEAAYAGTVLGLKPDDGYFNSGMLLLDLDAMRRDNTSTKLFDALARIESLSLPDQDILNSVCKGRVRFLGNKWNLHDWMADPVESCTKFHFAREETKMLARQSRGVCNILHFSERKPWRNVYSGSLGGEYWRYAALTPLHQETLAAWQAANKPSAAFRECARCLFHLLRCGAARAAGSRETRAKNARRMHDYWDTLRTVARNFLRKEPDMSQSFTAPAGTDAKG